MNYCTTPWNNNGVLSKWDVEGIQTLYGKPAVTPRTEYAHLRVKNEGLTKTWFRVTYRTHGNNQSKVEEKYLNFNESYDFKMDKNAVIDEVEGQFLDIFTWRPIFKEGHFVFTGGGDEICYRVIGKDAWRCDRGLKENR